MLLYALISVGVKLMDKKSLKSDKEWQQELPPEVYKVCRASGTELPFSGEYVHCDKEGIYHCRCCDWPLFSHETKFDSGSGWPSFFQTLNPDSVRTITDSSHGMSRTEVRCKNCDAHLGHVFDDGPNPTGLRYCMNSVSLTLHEEEPKK